MTVEQLNKANELQKEIEQLNRVFSMLDSTIVFEEDRGTPIKSFIRFINGKLKLGEECKAHVILFMALNILAFGLRTQKKKQDHVDYFLSWLITTLFQNCQH